MSKKKTNLPEHGGEGEGGESKRLFLSPKESWLDLVFESFASSKNQFENTCHGASHTDFEHLSRLHCLGCSMIVHTDPEENVITMIMLMVMVIQMYMLQLIWIFS